MITYEGNEITYGGDNNVTIKNTKSNVYELSITKADKNTNTKKLKNAKFKIRKLSETNASIMETDTSFTPYEVETDVNGAAKFDNLPAGTYEIEETSMPAGYVLSDFGGKAYIKVTASDIVLLKGVAGKAPNEWSALPADDPDYVYLSLDATNLSLTIYNEPGSALPSTGGPGTWTYILFGGVLSIAAFFLLRNRRLKPLRKHYTGACGKD